MLRRRTNDSLTSFPDEDVDLLFEDAESKYSAYSREAQLQTVVVTRIEELWTASITQVTYKQNETSENLSDIAKNLKAKLDMARKKLDEVIYSEQSPAVAIATLRKVPSYKKEYPRS